MSVSIRIDVVASSGRRTINASSTRSRKSSSPIDGRPLRKVVGRKNLSRSKLINVVQSAWPGSTRNPNQLTLTRVHTHCQAFAANRILAFAEPNTVNNPRGRQLNLSANRVLYVRCLEAFWDEPISLSRRVSARHVYGR
jgi:hypothetical protein